MNAPARLRLALASMAALFTLAAAPAHAGKTLDGIKQRGAVACGVHTGRAGFALADGSGNWSGLDVDLCRAVAAATLGDASKVKFIPTSGQTRITALQSGEIDLLARNTTWTFTRDNGLGLMWAGINFHDGQGFMARKKPGLNSVKQLSGATICVISGSTTEKTLSEYFRAHKLNYKAVVFDNPEAALQAFSSGRCQAYTGDLGALAVLRGKELVNPDDYVILPEFISKEPAGPAVRNALRPSLLRRSAGTLISATACSGAPSLGTAPDRLLVVAASSAAGAPPLRRTEPGTSGRPPVCRATAVTGAATRSVAAPRISPITA